MTWRAPTKRDLTGTNTRESCDGCGRRTQPDMLMDFSAVPDELRAPRLRVAGIRWVCDGCRERAYLLGEMDRGAVLAALGATQEVLDAVGGAE